MRLLGVEGVGGRMVGECIDGCNGVGEAGRMEFDRQMPAYGPHPGFEYDRGLIYPLAPSTKATRDRTPFQYDRGLIYPRSVDINLGGFWDTVAGDDVCDQFSDQYDQQACAWKKAKPVVYGAMGLAVLAGVALLWGS